MDRIRAAVQGELGRFGPATGMADLVAVWPEAVGEAIARNAWPARIARDGTLHVNALDSVWAFELQHRAPEIAERLGVPAVRFVPGPVPEPEPEAAVKAAVAVAVLMKRRRLKPCGRSNGFPCRFIFMQRFRSLVVLQFRKRSFCEFSYNLDSRCPEAPGFQGFFYE